MGILSGLRSSIVQRRPASLLQAIGQTERGRPVAEELFDEGAANVRRLLDRDRKELLNENQKTEFDAEYERPDTSSDSSNGSSSASTSKPSVFDDGTPSSADQARAETISSSTRTSGCHQKGPGSLPS